MGPRNLKSGPHAYMASALLTKHIPILYCVLLPSRFHFCMLHRDHYFSGREENFKKLNCEVTGTSLDSHISHTAQVKILVEQGRLGR